MAPGDLHSACQGMRYLRAVLAPPNSCHQLLFVSRQTYTECHALFLRLNNIHFDNPVSVGRFLQRTGESRRQHIVSLSFVWDLPVCQNPPRWLDLLAVCPNLKSLKVDLPRATNHNTPDPRLKRQLQNVRGLSCMSFVLRGKPPCTVNPDYPIHNSEWDALRELMMQPRSE